MMDLQPIPVLSKSDIHRFWAKVAITANDEKCWDWQASVRRGGYGRFNLTIEKNKDKSFVSTRIAYFVHYKTDPLDKIVLHTCDNPICVNPRHLRLGTNKENTEDMMIKNRGIFKTGESHGKVKLTEDIVRRIRTEYKKGVLLKDLSIEYNVNPSTLSLIVNFKTLKHVN